MMSNTLKPFQMKTYRDALQDQAIQFLCFEVSQGAQIPSKQDNLRVERCAAHLMASCDCSQVEAEREAAKALAEMSSHATGWYFEIDESTSFAVFVRDPSGRVRVISAEKLGRMLTVDQYLADNVR